MSSNAIHNTKRDLLQIQISSWKSKFLINLHIACLDHRIAQVRGERDLTDHPDPTPCLTLFFLLSTPDQAAQSPNQPGLGHFQRQDIHSFKIDN